MNRRFSTSLLLGAVFAVAVVIGLALTLPGGSSATAWAQSPLPTPTNTHTPDPNAPTPTPTNTPTPTSTPDPNATPTPTPTNVPPLVTVAQPSVTVDEGRFATNSGTATDPDGAIASLGASPGIIGGGSDDVTWRWVFNASDGPDQSQTVTIDASDEGGATGQGTFELTVKNVAPVVVGETIIVEPPEPVIVSNQSVQVTAVITDQGFLDTHVGVWAWGDGGGCTTDTDADCALDQSRGGGVVHGTHSYAEPGVYSIVLAVSDDDGGHAEAISSPVVVYDPEGGFVTGGGWINSPAGAYVANPSLAGKATFGFVSRYKKGASEPDGNTQFLFQAGDLKFHSDSYQWLVIAGHKAQYKGTGTINGAGNYGFMLSAIDADLTPSTDVDKFRIKIWNKDDGDDLIYDNQVECSETGDDGDPCTEIGGGSIVIHKGKGKK